MDDPRVNIIGASLAGIGSILSSIWFALEKTAQAAIPDGVLDPDRLFLPLGIVIGLFGGAIWFTVKLVRLVDKWENTLKAHKALIEELTLRLEALERPNGK